jgi:hypothetical protein
VRHIIVRPLGPDRAAMGRSFEDLKNYLRCPQQSPGFAAPRFPPPWSVEELCAQPETAKPSRRVSSHNGFAFVP